MKAAPSRLYATFVTVALWTALSGFFWSAYRLLQAPPPTPDVAAQAKRLLVRLRGAPVSEPLAEILATSRTWNVATQPHPLLDKSAPDFVLTAADDKPVRLSEAIKRGPVVLVFYYGYYCDHCVAQLFALNEDLAYFRELGAEILAISADAPAETRLSFAKYAKQGGHFQFPVLSDPDQKVAQTWGTHVPFAPGKPEVTLHGTFLIDGQGIVRWVHTGLSPFAQNKSLLCELARVAGSTAAAVPKVTARGQP